ncbi:MAG: DUF4845 domain-containing protein [Neptuniibacter sp.]
MKSSYKSQQGYTFTSALFVILVFGAVFTIGFKLYSPYFDYSTIDKVLTNVINNPEELRKHPTILKKDLQKKWDVNQITLPHKDALIIRKLEGFVVITLDYEVRVPMFFNVDAMVKFDKEYKAKSP